MWLLEFLYTSNSEADINRMQDKSVLERRVIFRPYSQNSSGANIFVCTCCGMQFTQQGDMGEMAMRFAEHLCDPIIVQHAEGTSRVLTH
jgi:hypothetical protein